MIVEIKEDSLQGQLGRDFYLSETNKNNAGQALAPLFNHLELRAPKAPHIVESRESGYLIMLNEFASVLRVYPAPFFTERENAINHNQHIYHHMALPYLGLVNFPNFICQLMPGIQHSYNHNYATISNIHTQTFGDTGASDFSPRNYGLCAMTGHTLLLDTVDTTGSNYDYYLEDQGHAVIDAYSRYDKLQNLFFDSWNGQQSFSTFWNAMKEQKKTGLLSSGWNESQHNMNFHSKGDIVKSASLYEKHNKSVLYKLGLVT